MENFQEEMRDHFQDFDHEKKKYIVVKIAEAKGNEDGFTLSALHVQFFVDKVGEYLGDSCVQLVCLSATIELISHD